MTKRGYRVATIKHVHDEGFTIDVEGKDTWRHARAGAKAVVCVSPKELAVIRKVSTSKYGLEDLLKYCEGADIVLLEGFKELVGRNPLVQKIIAVKEVKEALEASSLIEPVLAFVGFEPLNAMALSLRAPYIIMPDGLDELTNMVESLLKEKGPLGEGLTIYVNGDMVPVNPFVCKIVRNTVLAVVSSLKGPIIRGDERVTIVIESKLTA